MYAVNPVGVNPVENPWKNLSHRKALTVATIGYIKEQTRHTTDPRIITGTLPMVSASLPLKGLDNIAVSVNRETINPLYSPPPIRSSMAGSSGMTILKEPKKKKDPRHNSQNWRGYALRFIRIRRTAPVH
jgi:hypothetical protein